LGGLSEAIDVLVETDVADLDRFSRLARIEALQQQLSRLQAELTRTVGVADAQHDIDGVTMASWLAWKTHVPKAQAAVSVANARALRRMPAVEEAFAAGEVSADHVRVLAAACRANRERFDKVEDELVADARTCRFDGFARRVAYFRQDADPDGVEADARDVHDRRHLHASRSFEDGVRVDGWLDAVGGGVFLNELTRLEQDLFEHDWAEARAAFGERATVEDLGRTPAQRRADALREMAERSAAMPADAVRGRYLLTVLVGYETFNGRICQLADGTVVTPGQVAGLLAEVDVERVVFDGPSRVIDVGYRRRLFTGGGRRAVQVRDLECQGHPACDTGYERCQVDHIQPWEHHGPTDTANGRLLCKRCHRRRQQRPERPPPTGEG